MIGPALLSNPTFPSDNEARVDNCIFCKIASKQIQSKLVYEDEDLVAFHDINPAAAMHLLIIPKQHIATLADCDGNQAALLGKMMLLAPKLAQQFGCGYQAAETGRGTGGFKTLINVGPAGGQEVYHLHMHVIGTPVQTP